MIGVYLHIPFCQHKCSYCDFYSIENFEQREVFLKMLLREITLRTEEDFPEVHSVFFGGGTPSLLTGGEIAKLTEALHSKLKISQSCEWTMECNPGTVSLESLQEYRSAGINRLSFGVQSFDENELRFLERIHSADQAREAVDYARKAGFDNINVDMMFALPEQQLSTFQDSLTKALSLETEHFSAYSLIYEEGTPLYAQFLRNEVAPQSEEADTQMYQWAIENLKEHGYQQYEVSNFAKAGRECRHNLCYWSAGEYLAFGPSAHGYIRDTRYWNPRSLHRYNELLNAGHVPTLNSEVLTRSDRMFERCFLELRAQGIRIREFDLDFGVRIDILVRETAMWMVEEQYIELGDRVSLTAKGYSQCDEITLKLIEGLEAKTKSNWRQISMAEEPKLVQIESSDL